MGRPKTCIPRTAASRHGTRRFTTPTDSVAAARSNVAAEMCRAITRTVLFDQTAASISMKRVDDTNDACARSPARAPFTVTSGNRHHAHVDPPLPS